MYDRNFNQVSRSPSTEGFPRPNGSGLCSVGSMGLRDRVSKCLHDRSIIVGFSSSQITFVTRRRIWLEPDLSGEFVVDEEGVVTLPMLGRVRAVDLTIAQLRALLIERYTKELRNPSITVTPVRRVYVLGEVNRPGMYGLDPTASLASAVALAGGANREGDLRKLTLIRGDATILSGVDPMADLLSIGTRSGDQIFVERRSWLERNQQFVATTVLGVAGIAVALINR